MCQILNHFCHFSVIPTAINLYLLMEVRPLDKRFSKRTQNRKEWDEGFVFGRFTWKGHASSGRFLHNFEFLWFLFLNERSFKMILGLGGPCFGSVVIKPPSFLQYLMIYFHVITKKNMKKGSRKIFEMSINIFLWKVPLK